MELTRWDNGETIHGSEHDTIKECVEDSIKKGVSLYRINLRGADMRDANMTGANLAKADLTGVNLTNANLAKADLTGANLRYANMRYANLRDTDMRYDDLRYTDLRYTDLRCTYLRDANMRYADLDFSSWPLWCGSCRVKLDKENNERFAYHAMINMNEDVLAEFLQNPVEFANRFAVRKGFIKIKAGEE